jgi:hypothetical protein
MFHSSKRQILLKKHKCCVLSSKLYYPCPTPDLGIISSFDCYYQKQLAWKAVTMTDGVLTQDARSTRLNNLNAIHFTGETRYSVKASTIKNCFTNGGFLFDDISLWCSNWWHNTGWIRRLVTVATWCLADQILDEQQARLEEEEEIEPKPTTFFSPL